MNIQNNISRLLTAIYILFISYGPLDAETKTLFVEIRNTSDTDRTDEPFALALKEMNAAFLIRSARVWDGGREIPSQIDDLDGDLLNDELAFVLDIHSLSSKTLKIELSSEKSSIEYPSRVYAELMLHEAELPILSLTVPYSSNPYNQILHHGPSFESELVAYRIYFDSRQTIDPYGKFNKGLEIAQSHFYPNDEQLKRGFGDDVLMVGNSCGVGALRFWDGEKATFIEPYESLTETVRSFGPVRTVVDVFISGWRHQGWESNVFIRYILYSGHRDCEIQVTQSDPLNKEYLCTGVENIKGSASFSDHAGLVACWGTDWPVTDTVKYKKETVGLATCVPEDMVIKEASDGLNYLFVLDGKGKTTFTYHTMFTSSKETFGYKTKEAWYNFAKAWKKRLHSPCKITYIQ